VKPIDYPGIKSGETMSERSYEAHGIRVLECATEGKKLQNDRDAVELIGEAMNIGARLVVVPVERISEDFFRLRTRIAGEIVQKFVQYRRHLAIVGDIAPYVAESSAFAAFVNEANRGDDLWFVADHVELDRRLEQRTRESQSGRG
jgi:hypothetical protein